MHGLFFISFWICNTIGAPQSEVSVQKGQESCVLTLTIPKESIKSDCSMNEQLLRKMQSMESQFNHYKTLVGALEIRLPEIVLNMNRYNDKVEQLELMIAKESTYFKHMDGKIKVLEEALSKTSESNKKTQQSEPDTLLDPLRPYVMAELQQMKEDLRKELLKEIIKENNKEKMETLTDDKLTSAIKPLILAEMQYVKEEILKSMKNRMTVKMLDQNEEIGSSDEIGEHISEEASIQPVNQQINMLNMAADQGVTKDRTMQEMARTIHTINDNVNVSVEDLESEVSVNITNDFESTTNITNRNSTKSEISENPYILTESLKKTINMLQSMAQKNMAKEINDKIELVRKEVEAKLEKAIGDFSVKLDKKVTELGDNTNSLDEKFQGLASNLTDQQHDLTRLVQKVNFSDNIKILNRTVSQILTDIQSMDRRIDSYTNDVALDSKIQTKVESIKTNLEMSLLGIQSSVSSFENKISQLERQSNLSLTLVNHFKKTIIHNHNETHVNFESMKSDISELENRLKEEISEKTNVADLEDRLQDLEMDYLFSERSIEALKKNSSTGYRKLDIKLSELNSKTQSIEWQLTSLQDHAQRILEIERNQTIIKNNHDLMNKVLDLIHLEQKLGHDRWIEFNFTQHSLSNACNKKQLVKRNKVTKNGLGTYVGVQLCSPTRYKIFLGNSLDEEFLDIADQYGYGQDHCQFIGGETEKEVKVDIKHPSPMGMKG